MPQILQDLPIKAPVERVFAAISTPAGLDQWWTRSSAGMSEHGALLALCFGTSFNWHARVTAYQRNVTFELQMVEADADWTGTRVRFELGERDSRTWLRFSHVGWPHDNEHYRISSHCWAMYLRVLRRFLEHGETVSYDDRLVV